MVGPVDANIKAYIDQAATDQVFGTDKVRLEQDIVWIKKQLVILRQKIVYLRLTAATQVALTLGDPDTDAACLDGAEILRRAQEWFDGAMRDAEDPFNVYDEWMIRLDRDLKPVTKVVATVRLSEYDKIEYPPESPDDY